MRKCYQAMPLEAIAKEDWRILTLTVITKFGWLNDFTDLPHDAFVTSATSNKNVSPVHLLPCLFFH